MWPWPDTTRPSNSENKSEWNYTSTPPYALNVRRHIVYFKVQFVFYVLEFLWLLFET
jgi:hypothetical protein